MRATTPTPAAASHDEPRGHETDPAVGLTASEVAARVERGDVNLVSNASSRSLWSILSANLFTLFNLIIAVGTAVLLLLGRWQDALFSFAALSNVIIGVVQEYTAKRKLDSLAVLHATRARVVRDGHVAEIPTDEIVRDDILLLRRGDQVPADATVLVADGFDVDEAILTGESEPIIKHAGDAVLASSGVTSGSATVRVTRIGEESFAAKLTAEAKRFSLVGSELRSALNRVVKWISWVIVPVAALVVHGQIVAAGGWESALASGAWQDAVVRAIGSVSAAVPQGLILMTSIAFAVAAVKLSRRQVLTQELAAVEGLARVDVICLDKTGTLTEGDIRLETAAPIRDGVLETPLTAEQIEQSDARAGWQQALAWFGADDNANPTALALATPFPHPPAEQRTAQVPFSSARRSSAVSFAEGPARGTWVLGAPESILGGDRRFEAVREAGRAHAGRGARALVLAHTEHVMTAAEADAAEVPAAQPVAVLSFVERVRDDAAATLRYFEQQRVGIFVLSGDHPRTVGAVARAVGLPLDGDAYDATELPKDARGLERVLEQHRIFGRVAPEQKQSIVTALQSLGHTVAMTGDGVNDALALKTADLGIAMGNGAAATKAVARLVLLDGKFSRLPGVVAEGRQVIANIERVSRIFLTKTAYAFSLAVAFGLLMWAFPFLPRQLSATDGLTIGIPAFLLALMPNPRRYVPGFLGRSLRFCIPAGLIVCASIVTVTGVGRLVMHASEPQVQTAVVIALTIIGLWVLVIASRPMTLFRVAIVVAMILGLLAALFIPFVAAFFLFELPPLNVLWLAIGVAAVGAALIEVVHRVAPRVPVDDDPVVPEHDQAALAK